MGRDEDYIKKQLKQEGAVGISEAKVEMAKWKTREGRPVFLAGELRVATTWKDLTNLVGNHKITLAAKFMLNLEQAEKWLRFLDKL